MKNLQHHEARAVVGGTVYADSIYTVTGDSSKTIFSAGAVINMTKDNCMINFEANEAVFSLGGYALSETQNLMGVHVGGSTIYTLHDTDA